MAKIPVKIDSRSVRPREVTVDIYIDGQHYVTETRQVPEFAIPFVAAAAVVQIDDPDVDGAIEQARDAGEPLPPGF